MRRREFIAGIGGAAAWPLVARAQQPTLPTVGLLNGVSFEGPYAAPVIAIRQGLQEAGFVEGQNLAIEYRTADGAYERLPDLAADLVHRGVAVIIAIGAPRVALAATTAPTNVPIVFATGSDVCRGRRGRRPRPAGGRRDGREPRHRGTRSQAPGIASRPETGRIILGRLSRQLARVRDLRSERRKRHRNGPRQEDGSWRFSMPAPSGKSKRRSSAWRCGVSGRWWSRPMLS